MKITLLSIRFDPTEKEIANPRVLTRNEKKLWTAISLDELYGTNEATQGLYSGEIMVAHLLSEIISAYNSGGIDNWEVKRKEK